MILDVICFRNKKLKCYANPTYTQEKLENLETNMARSIIIGGPQAVAKYKNLALYHFGTFDDATGVHQFLKEPELLFDCDDIIAAIPEE